MTKRIDALLRDPGARAQEGLAARAAVAKSHLIDAAQARFDRAILPLIRAAP
ncbi:MAG: hypothetical protein GDA36_07890 [Rhodobacteraceae bacterium]|nr:hypothetical protein [Paracoccaceae bacterium]